MGHLWVTPCKSECEMSDENLGVHAPPAQLPVTRLSQRAPKENRKAGHLTFLVLFYFF